MKLDYCPFCGNTKQKITYMRGNNPHTGQDGFYAQIKCECPAFMSAWAQKKEWAEKTVAAAWNRRTESEVSSLEKNPS